jgi:tetratricopeptide (TPR) repeat protein
VGKGRKYLDLANRSQASLEQEKSVARRQTQSYKNELTRYFHAGGYLDSDEQHQLPAEVTDVTKLDSVEAEYLREIQDLQASLGDATLLLDRLNLRLLDIKIGKRKFEHAESILHHLMSHVSTRNLSGEPAWTFVLEDYWTYINFLKGDYEAAETSCRRTAQNRLSSFGEGHISHINSMIQLVRILQHRSKYEECEETGLKVIDISERYLGLAHQDTMTILLLVGNSMGYSGKNSRAEEMFYKAMRGLEKIRGTAHEDTLACYTSLGEILRQQGKYEDSEIFIDKAIKGYKEKVGENNPETLNALDILALLRLNQGRHAEAEQLCRDIIKAFSEVYGDEHPDTLNSISNLVLILYNLEKYGEAETLCRQALQSREKPPVNTHELLITMNNLGLVLYGQDKYHEAEAWFRKALDGFNDLFGSDRPHALFSMHNVAFMLHLQRRSEEAEPLISHVWENRKKVSGIDHPETLNSQTILGMIVNELGNHELAVNLLRDAAGTSDTTLGPDHPASLKTISRLGDVLAQGDERDASEAVVIYQRLYETLEKTNGTYHSETLNARNSYAVMLHKLGKLQESEDLLDISIFRRALGNNHPETQAALQNLAVVYEDQDRFDEAEELLRNMGSL